MGSRMRNVVVTFLAFTLGVIGPALADQVEKGPPALPGGSMPGPGMMGGGMMGMMHRGMGPGGPHAMMGHGGAGERALVSFILQNREELGLTPEQIQKLETLRLDFRRATIKRSADLQVAELELAELRRNDPVDMGKVEAQVKQIETLRTEQRLSRIKAIEEGKALLTREQQKKLDIFGQRAGDVHATGGMMGCPMMGGMGGMMGPSSGGESK